MIFLPNSDPSIGIAIREATYEKIDCRASIQACRARFMLRHPPEKRFNRSRIGSALPGEATVNCPGKYAGFGTGLAAHRHRM